VPPGGVIAVQPLVDGVHQGRDERGEHGGSGVNRRHVLATESQELREILEAVTQVRLQAGFIDVLHRQLPSR